VTATVFTGSGKPNRSESPTAESVVEVSNEEEQNSWKQKTESLRKLHSNIQWNLTWNTVSVVQTTRVWKPRNIQNSPL
jgi:hypothetical protein